MSSKSSVGGAVLFGFVTTLFYLNEARKRQVYRRKSQLDETAEVIIEVSKEVEEEGLEEEENEDEDVEEDTGLADQQEVKRLEDVALRESYDNALRLAHKLLAGNAYKRAADKFTEAIDLAPKISSARNDLVSLYNNRSAMYEKAGEFNMSLLDITIVLTLDSHHIKARARRGRIYEAMEDYEKAMDDYVMVTFLERHKEIPTTTEQKAELMCKMLTTQYTTNYLLLSRNAVPYKEEEAARATLLPAKSYCRTLFESLPSVYIWREQYKTTNREDLSVRWESNLIDPACPLPLFLSSALELAQFDISKSLFSKGFKTVNLAMKEIKSRIEGIEIDVETSALLSILWQLKGEECLLRQYMQSSAAYLNQALLYDSSNLEASLALAIVYLELAEIDKADKTYSSCLSEIGPVDAENEDTDTNSSNEMDNGTLKTQNCRKAWILTHRATMYITKDENGKVPPDGQIQAMKDIDIVMNITEFANEGMGDSHLKSVRLVAVLKKTQILSQINLQSGQPATPEDQERIKLCIMEAKTLYPKHEANLLLEADLLSSEGAANEALEIIDSVMITSDKSDTMPLIIKANILMQNGFAFLNESAGERMAEAQAVFQEVQKMYQRAIEAEPNALEAMAQSAQLKCMLGEMKEAFVLTELALSCARNREEALELSSLNFFTRAQARAETELTQDH